MIMVLVWFAQLCSDSEREQSYNPPAASPVNLKVKRKAVTELANNVFFGSAVTSVKGYPENPSGFSVAM